MVPKTAHDVGTIISSCVEDECAWLLSCVQLCDPMGGSPLSTGILQAIILEWVAMSSSSRCSQSRDWTQVSWIAGRFFTVWALGKPWGFEREREKNNLLIAIKLMSQASNPANLRTIYPNIGFILLWSLGNSELKLGAQLLWEL